MNRNIDFIPFAKPVFSDDECRRVSEVLESGWLTTGKKALELENRFCELSSGSYALAVNSATAGLHLALEAIGIGPGDKVLTTPYTFTASAEIIRYLGADPVFADIDPETQNISIQEIEIRLKAEAGIKAVIPVHFGGYPVAMDDLLQLTEPPGIPVVEDSAHALPVTYKGKLLGSWGTAGVFSFYANKPVTTGEGGLILTDSDRLQKRMKIMRLHGIDRDVWDRYHSTKETPSWEYDIVAPGFKYNMTDIAAAIGLAQLDKVLETKQARKEIASRYLRELEEEDWLDLPLDFPDHCWHLFCIRLKLDKLKINRNEFISILQNLGIGTSVHYKPLHLMTYYKSTYGYKQDDFPFSFSVFSSTVSLPIYAGLDDGKTDRIIHALKETGRKFRK